MTDPTIHEAAPVSEPGSPPVIDHAPEPTRPAEVVQVRRGGTPLSLTLLLFLALAGGLLHKAIRTAESRVAEEVTG